MYICICKNVTDTQIRKCVRDRGVKNLRGLRRELDACDQCGKCAGQARQIIAESVAEISTPSSRQLLTAA